MDEDAAAPRDDSERADEIAEQFRRQARERERRKQLLVAYITKQRAHGARMDELQHVLPDLSRSQIQVLLRELVRDDSVHVRGRTKAARWYPGLQPAAPPPPPPRN